MITSRTPIWPATTKFGSAACMLCQWHSFSTSCRNLTQTPASPSNKSTLDEAKQKYGNRDEEFVPKPLNRPIGLRKPPQPGDGVDRRTLQQKRDDFVNWDKHLARREQLKATMSKPYFRDWMNTRWQKGKTFIAPPRLFKGDRALYFPNFHAQTLAKGKEHKDTTNVLQNKVSIVNIFCSKWADDQTATFSSERNNPELHEIVKSTGGLAQIVHINVEYDWLKGMIIKMFMRSLRKRIGEANWNRYFLLWEQIPDEIREEIGVLNQKVGYVYLVDGDCKIRWASSGACGPEEKESLNKGTRRLVEELQNKKLGGAIDAVHRNPLEAAKRVPEESRELAEAVA